ncbi:MAG: PEP-CTERM sorting domain-containing protein [Verrucomicrobiota bacterium]
MKTLRLPLVFLFGVFAMLIRVEAQTLYGITGAGQSSSILYQVNSTTGAIVSTIGNTGLVGITAMRFNPADGLLYAVTTGDRGVTSNLYRINTTTAQPTLIGATGLTGGVPDMAFSSSGTLYAWNENGDSLITISTTTGGVTPAGISGIDTYQTGLAFSPGGTLYLKSDSDFYSLNVGASSSTFLFTSGQSLSNMLAFNNAGVAYSGLRTGSATDLFTINMTTGDATLLGRAGAPFSALAFSTSAIPEPSTYAAIAGMGVLALAVYRRRRS